MRLQNKVSLITGGASGLGKETAILLAREGSKVVITDLNEDGLKEVTEQIKSSNGEVLYLIHDVTQEEDWKSVIDKVLSTYGKLDVVVNNAGVGIHGNVEDTTFENWRKVLNINLDGVFLGTKYGIQAMKKTGNGGSIINMSSIAGIVGDPELAAYCASKGGVRLFTKSAALHCAKTGTGIRVNSVHPAYINTPLMELVPNVDEIRSMHPVGHFGEPVDVASGVLYLASDESKFTTGSELLIDGGYTAQ